MFQQTQTTEYLLRLKAFGIRPGLDRIRDLVQMLGHPERRPTVHIAGTNGKGSVGAMLEAILRAAGWHTGLYTSPHLRRLGERIRVDGLPISDDLLEQRILEVRAVLARRATVRGAEPSYFEFMTGVAFRHFALSGVDISLIEAGLGGARDATNVVSPKVAVITSIGYDHLEHLGDNLEGIAREKAGIIKPGRPVVVGRLPAEAERVVREIARQRQAPVHSVREVYGESATDYPATNLEGDYQRWNAATATLAARLLREQFHLADATIARGLQQVDWPGRWQRTSIGGRPLILDASHNPEGAQVLEVNLGRLVAATGRKPVIVTGVLGEFRARALLDVVCRHAREVHLVPPQTARASTYEQMEAVVPAEMRPLLRRSTLDEVFPDTRTCSVGAAGDTIVVTGSIYLLGEVLARIEPSGGGGEPWLQDF